MARINGSFIGKGYQPTSSTSKPGIYDRNYIMYGTQLGDWTYGLPPTTVVGNVLGTATTGTFVIPAGCTSIKLYGCAGGGDGAISGVSALNGGGGGGGGASQINGYPLSVTPGQTYAYTVGSYGQVTTVTLGGSTVFTLAEGASASGATGGAGGVIGSYGSSAGGAGGAGGGRYSNGSPGGAVGGCCGGGGGGGYGDNSPVTNGGTGGAGGSSTAALTTTMGGIAVSFTGQTGGNGGAVQSAGSHALYAYGGSQTGTGVWLGGGGGAGGGIKCAALFPIDNAFGAGGGGSGPYMSTNTGKGGPGFLVVQYL
jgi:hypothetical protein